MTGNKQIISAKMIAVFSIKISTLKSPIRSSVPVVKNENRSEEETFSSVGITEHLRMRGELTPKKCQAMGRRNAQHNCVIKNQPLLQIFT
jgi:hypothetical protein